MAGFLADIGRAQPAKQITGFLKDVEDIKGARVAREISGQTQQLNEITLNKARADTERTAQITALARQPKTFDNMFSNASLFAPNTIGELKGVTTGAGVVDAQGVTSAEKFQLWGEANPREFKNFIDKGIGEIDAGIAQKKRLITGFIDPETGKFTPPDKNADVLQGQIQQAQRAQNALLSQSSKFEQETAKIEATGREARLTAGTKPGTTKTGVNFVTPSGDVVLSVDGGLTDRTGAKIPPGSIKVTGQTPLSETLAQRARTEAVQDIETQPTGAVGFDAREAALAGTGPFATLAAATDAVLGGIGLDKIFGDDGFFPDIQEARQQLRLLKQTGKAALLNSARGAIWEQEKIDQLFPDPDKIVRNPRTEAQKLKAIKTTLRQEVNFNNRKIASGATAKEIEKLRLSNFDLERTLEMLGGGAGAGAGAGEVTQEDLEFTAQKHGITVEEVKRLMELK